MKQLYNLETQLLFSEAAAKCDTSVGLNSLFGPKYCRLYSEHRRILYVKFDYVCGGLIDGFSTEELSGVGRCFSIGILLVAY